MLLPQLGSHRIHQPEGILIATDQGVESVGVQPLSRFVGGICRFENRQQERWSWVGVFGFVNGLLDPVVGEGQLRQAQ